MAGNLSHVGPDGEVRMVDVGGKPSTRRIAVAEACVLLSPQTFALLAQKALPKGDVLGAAKIAGIQAAKRTAELIPLCHPLPLSFVDVSFAPDAARSAVAIRAEARTEGQTGVEMEALTAAAVAALTVYDMCKAVQKDIVISSVRLVYKSGGKSGTYTAPGFDAPRPAGS